MCVWLNATLPEVVTSIDVHNWERRDNRAQYGGKGGRGGGKGDGKGKATNRYLPSLKHQWFQELV